MTGGSERTKTLILGIGNTLLSDEGIGVHVLADLENSASPVLENVTTMDGGTLSFTLAGPIENCEQFIVIDAAELKSDPGTVRDIKTFCEQTDNILLSSSQVAGEYIFLIQKY